MRRAGDCWTWTALDSDSKLIISYTLGRRDGGYAHEFMRDVASRLSRKVQLTTDGHKAYLDAVDDAFGGDIDYAMLVKLYGAERPGEARYSPANIIGIRKEEICGSRNRDLSARAMSSGRIFRCEWGCAGLPALQTPIQRRLRITAMRSRSTSCTTITAKFTPLPASHPRWPLACQRQFGRLRIY